MTAALKRLTLQESSFLVVTKFETWVLPELAVPVAAPPACCTEAPGLH